MDTVMTPELIGPDTVNTMPEATLLAFQDHRTVAPAQLDAKWQALLARTWRPR